MKPNRLFTALALSLVAVTALAWEHPKAGFAEFGIQYSPTLSGYKLYTGQTVVYVPAIYDGKPRWEEVEHFEKKGGVFNALYVIKSVSGSDDRVIFHLSPIEEGRPVRLVFDNRDGGKNYYRMSPSHQIPLLLSDDFEAFRTSMIGKVYPEGNSYGPHVTVSDVYWEYDEKFSIYNGYPRLMYTLKKSYDGSEVPCQPEDLHHYSRLGEKVGDKCEIVDIIQVSRDYCRYVLKNSITDRIFNCGASDLKTYAQIGMTFPCKDSTEYVIADITLQPFSKEEPVLYTLCSSGDNDEMTVSGNNLSDVYEIGTIWERDLYDHAYKVIGIKRDRIEGKKYLIRNTVTRKIKTVPDIHPIDVAFRDDPMISGYDGGDKSDLRSDRKGIPFARSSQRMTSATGWYLDEMDTGKWISNQNFIWYQHRSGSKYWQAHASQNFFFVCTKEIDVGGHKFYAVIVGKYVGFDHDYEDTYYYEYRPFYYAYVFSAREYAKLYDLSGHVVLKTVLETYFQNKPYSDAEMSLMIARLFESQVFRPLGKYPMISDTEFEVRVSSDGKIRFRLPESGVLKHSMDQEYFETTRENFEKIILRPAGE